MSSRSEKIYSCCIHIDRFRRWPFFLLDWTKLPSRYMGYLIWWQSDKKNYFCGAHTDIQTHKYRHQKFPLWRNIFWNIRQDLVTPYVLFADFTVEAKGIFYDRLIIKKTTGKPINWIICFSPVLSIVFLQKSFTKIMKFVVS